MSLPVAVGLIRMMYPRLAAVNYREIGRVVTTKKKMSLSLVLNWAVGLNAAFQIAFYSIYAYFFITVLPSVSIRNCGKHQSLRRGS